MKFLETLSTVPHPMMLDLKDVTIKTYLKEEFEVELNNIDVLKDIINIYSYLLMCERPEKAFKKKEYLYIIDDYELSVPMDSNILHASCVTFIKIYLSKGRNKTYKKISMSEPLFLRINDVEETKVEFINMLNDLVLSEYVSIKDMHRMESLYELYDIPVHNYFMPNFDKKFASKSFYVSSKRRKKLKVGVIIVDFSMSMYTKNNALSKLFKHNLKISKSDLIQIYSATTKGIKFIGLADSQSTFIDLVSSIGYTPGRLNTDKMITRLKEFKSKITFLTDAEDFSTERLSSININLILLKTDNYELIKYGARGGS